MAIFWVKNTLLREKAKILFEIVVIAIFEKEIKQ